MEIANLGRVGHGMAAPLGDTARRLIDCLIAPVAIRAGVRILHADADFEVLSRHSELRVDRT